MDERGLTGMQVAVAQSRLRTELGLDEELFPLEAFIGMVSDEIEQLRARGQDDAAIARLLAEASGVEMTADDLALHYATAAQRGKGPG